MDEFIIFLKIGLTHVLNIHAYDHLLFLIALTVPYIAKDWKRIIILVSCFTLGHTISLFLSVFNIVTVKSSWVEILIPITIFITAFSNLILVGKSSKNGNISFIAGVTIFFGIIHGLGFSNYFNTILPSVIVGSNTLHKIIVVIAVLILAFIAQNLLRFNKRDFTLIMSSFVIGVVVPLIIENPIWKK